MCVYKHGCNLWMPKIKSMETLLQIRRTHNLVLIGHGQNHVFVWSQNKMVCLSFGNPVHLEIIHKILGIVL